MDKKNVILRIILRSLLAGLGSMMGALITLLLFLMLPSSYRIAPSLFVLNSGFFAAYWSSYRMKECVLAPYFICIFAVMSVIVCLRFYGMTWLCALNILGYLTTIAGCVFWGAKINLALQAAKRMKLDFDKQEKND